MNIKRGCSIRRVFVNSQLEIKSRFVKERVFRFKRFSVAHSRSAMKVGVDGVLVGAWADVSGAKSILDAGCGCGLIALMCAQRNETAAVDAVEVDSEAAAEAADNFRTSPWAERLTVFCADINELKLPLKGGYDRIVSNPPFFDSGVTQIDTGRQLARHVSTFSPVSLIVAAGRLLADGGRLTMIFPREDYEKIAEEAKQRGFAVSRVCHVRGREDRPVKRTLCELRRAVASETAVAESVADLLTLEISPGIPTQEYQALCKDFYLKF